MNEGRLFLLYFAGGLLALIALGLAITVPGLVARALAILLWVGGFYLLTALLGLAPKN